MNKDINIKNLMKLAAIGKPKRDAYYENTFQKMLAGKQNAWNWSAALLGPFWLIYRKAYGFAFLTLLGTMILGAVFEEVAQPNEALSTSLSVSSIILQGYMGNWFYLWSLKRKIALSYHKADLKNRDNMILAIFILTITIGCLVLINPEYFITQEVIICAGSVWLFLVMAGIFSSFIILIGLHSVYIILNDRRKVRLALKND